MNAVRAWGIGLGLAAGLVLAVAWWGAASDEGAHPFADFDVSRTRVPDTVAAIAPESTSENTPDSKPNSPPQPDQAVPPPGVNAAQWARIGAELLARPGGAAELQRLAGYLEWADALQRFRSARGTESPPADLARQVEAGLDERLRQREVSAAEAQRIKSAVLDITEPDAGSRERKLRAWAVATLPPPAVDAREAPFQQRQAEIVTAWSARPPAARDPAALARELDALRLQVYSNPADPGR